ncbi:hypothetical protein H3S98_10895 [Bartonella sp. B10834H15]|uniref:hypothetical protein n=1 Tax=Bartonella TaxID=773 RepID=UPI0018DE7CEB|nr:hypothetical protein [Bartonella choladocola]MBH9976176.1 hypothetical protein [Bartonella choladocola]MBI0015482.1 hypothetical protein [Bartonella sp. B10834G3]MBI0141051.1 hypothetical protein [Bartonella choladocola]
MLPALHLAHYEKWGKGKCGKCFYRIALLIISATPNLLRADHLQRPDYFQRADRFHCADRVRRANPL